MHVIKEKQIGPYKVKLVPDSYGDQECPLEGINNDGMMFVTFERRSTLSNYHQFGLPKDALEFAKREKWEVFNLYKYEHGGISYNIHPYSCPWDSGQVGIILIKKSMHEKKTRQKLAESLCRQVETWVNGDYYGFIIEDENGETIDSCFGFDDSDYCYSEASHNALSLANRPYV